jgi:hypothetical protein
MERARRLAMALVGYLGQGFHSKETACKKMPLSGTEVPNFALMVKLSFRELS